MPEPSSVLRRQAGQSPRILTADSHGLECIEYAVMAVALLLLVALLATHSQEFCARGLESR